MDSKDKLPPLPPSDPTSLQRNYHDSFYNLTVREVWGENQVTRHQVEDFKDCQHYFEHDQKTGGVTCNLCHVGYIGTFEIREGKLFLGGQPLEF